MEYLRVDWLSLLILSADGSGVLMWYVDASFAVHPNMRSHTGGGTVCIWTAYQCAQTLCNV
jgi:hypothetical protein